MSVFKRLAAAYMLLVAVAVAVHFLVTQFYDPMLEGTALTVWRVLDPLMVIGVAAALIAAFARKRTLDAGADEQPVSREYLSANAMFYPESTEGGRRVSVLKRQEGAPVLLG